MPSLLMQLSTQQRSHFEKKKKWALKLSKAKDSAHWRKAAQPKQRTCCFLFYFILVLPSAYSELVFCLKGFLRSQELFSPILIGKLNHLSTAAFAVTPTFSTKPLATCTQHVLTHGH